MASPSVYAVGEGYRQFLQNEFPYQLDEEGNTVSDSLGHPILNPEINLPPEELAAIAMSRDYIKRRALLDGGRTNAMEENGGPLYKQFQGAPFFSELSRGLQGFYHQGLKQMPAGTLQGITTMAGTITTPASESLETVWENSLVNPPDYKGGDTTILQILDNMGIDPNATAEEVPKKGHDNVEAKDDFRKFLEPVKQDALHPSQIKVAKDRERFILETTSKHPTLGPLWKWSDNMRQQSYEAGQDAINKNPKLKAWALWQEEELKDVTLGDFINPRMIGSFIGNALPTAALGFGSYIGGNAIFPGMGNALSFGIMFGLEGSNQYTDAYNELIEKGYPEEDARALASASAFQTGLINALLENLRWGSLNKAIGTSRLSGAKLRKMIMQKMDNKHGSLSRASRAIRKVKNYNGFLKTLPMQSMQEGMEEYLQGVNQRVSMLGYRDFKVGEILQGEDGEALIDFFGGLYGGAGFQIGISPLIYGTNKYAQRKGTLKQIKEQEESDTEEINRYNASNRDGGSARDAGEDIGTRVVTDFQGGPENLSHKEYLEELMSSDGKNIPSWRPGKKPSEDASDASQLAYRHSKEKKSPGGRILESMVKSGAGWKLLNELTEESKIKAGATLREYFRNRFHFQLGGDETGEGKMDDKTVNNVIDEVLKHYITKKGGVSIEKLTEEEQALSIGGILPETSLKLSDKLIFHKGSEDILKDLKSKLSVKYEAQIDVLRRRLEEGDITQDIYKSHVNQLKNVGAMLEAKMLKAGEDIPSQLRKKLTPEAMLENLLTPQGMLDYFQKNLPKLFEQDAFKKAAKQKNKKQDTEDFQEYDKEKQTGLEGLRAQSSKFLKENNNDVDLFAKNLSKMSVQGLKDLSKAYSFYIKPGENKRYIKDKSGEVIVSKRGVITKSKFAEILAEDIALAHGPKQTTGKKNIKKKEVKEEITKDEGRPVVDGNAESIHFEFIKRYGNLGPIAELASFLDSPSQFAPSLKKLGIKEDDIPAVIRHIKDFYGGNVKDPVGVLIKDARENMLGIKKDVSDVPDYWKEWRDNVVKGVEATIGLLAGTEGDAIIIGAMDSGAWKIYKGSFDSSWNQYLSMFSKEDYNVDDESLFKEFIRGARKGILKSDSQHKQIIKDWFEQWAINNDLGKGKEDLFGDHKILGFIPTVRSLSRTMYKEAVFRGKNIVHKMENENRESLDSIESDLKDDKVHGYDFVAEDVYAIVSTNMQRFLETSLLRYMNTDDMVNIQNVAYESEFAQDFVDFFVNNQDTKFEGKYLINDDVFKDSKVSNFIIRYYNAMRSRIPREEKKYFVLTNVDHEGNIGTGESPKLHLRLKTQDWKNRRALSGFASKSFIDDSPLGERTALLYASDVMKVYRTKKGKTGEVFDEETGLADTEKIWAKSEPRMMTAYIVNNLEIDLGNQYKTFGADNIMFIVGMKGGNSRAMIIGEVEDSTVRIALKPELRDEYFKKEVAEKRMTEEQHNNFVKYGDRKSIVNPNIWSQIIGRHEYWKTAFHQYYLMKDVPSADIVNNKNSIKWMFNRMRIVLSEGMSTYDAGPTEHITIDPSDTDMYYMDKKLVSWEDFLKEGAKRYGFDGVIFASGFFLEKMESSAGALGSDIGWLKTYISESSGDGNDFIGVKGLETRVIEGLSWRDREGNIIAQTVVESSKGAEYVNIVDRDGNYLDRVFSIEESKIGTAGVGKYNKLNERITLGAGATKILQTPGGFAKDSAAAPVQWLDVMLDPELMKNPDFANAYAMFTKHLLTKSKSYLDELINLRNHPKRVYHLLKRIGAKKTFGKPEMHKWLDAIDEDSAGILLHDHFVSMYEPMMKNRLIVDGAFKGRDVGFSSYLHIRPNMREDIEEWEAVVSVKDKSTWNKFKNLYINSLRSSRQRAKFRRMKIDDKVDVINDWLLTDPTDEWERWILDYRIPVNGIIAVNVDRLKRFSHQDTGDTAQFHIKRVLGPMQGDWDGDTAQLKHHNKEETEALLKLGRKRVEDGWEVSDLYKSISSIPKLDMYAELPHSDLSNFDAIVDTIIEDYTNAQAVGLVSNVIALRGTLSIKKFAITVRTKDKQKESDLTYSIVNPSDIIDSGFILKDSVTDEMLNPGEEIYTVTKSRKVGEDTVTREYKMHRMPSRNHMQVISQAALDDVKYTLLKMWKYDGPAFMMQQIFKRSDGKKLKKNEAQWLWDLVVPYFNYSNVRQGFTPTRRKASMHQVMGRYSPKTGKTYLGARGMSAGIMELKNMKSEELAEHIMNVENGSKKPEGKKFRRFITKVHLDNVTTHMEHLLSSPMEHFRKHLGDDIGIHPTYLRRGYNPNINAHRNTMVSLSEMLDEYRVPGAVFDNGITPDDEAAGNEFFRLMAKEFYAIADKARSTTKNVNRDSNFSLAAFDYDEEFTELKNKWAKKFHELSPQARFVSTINFLQGLSSPDQKEWSPDVKKQMADWADMSNALADLRSSELKKVANLKKEYKNTKAAIEKGVTQPTVVKPNKEGRMYMNFTGYQKDGVKASTTFDAVLSGDKTSTTRFSSLRYWGELKKGDIVKFKGVAGDVLYVQITKEPANVDFTKMSNDEMEKWTESEGWNMERALKHKRQGDKGLQFHFKLFKHGKPDKEVKLPTLSKLDMIERDAETAKMRAEEADKKQKILTAKIESFRDTKSTSVKKTIRNIERLLPFDLSSVTAMNIFGKEFTKNIKDKALNYEEPSEAFLLTYAKYFDIRLTKELSEKGKC